MLDLAGLRPLLAVQLHAEASGERLEATWLAMQAVFTGRAATVRWPPPWPGTICSRHWRNLPAV